uniref:Uncharacterized protein n=1 Tax=Leersia perrieri TaxID=77586 RepID=A0A0D9X505_9ORYZ
MGGGVMRTAAKVGIAGGAAAAAASAGGRFRHAAPAFATAASAEAAAATPLVSAGGDAPAVAQWGASSWEVDDWEFADWRDVAAAEPEVTAAGKPRLVFAPPSREEAEEATTELRDAIDRVYFSEAPVEVVKEQDKDLSKLGADAIIPAMPGHLVEIKPRGSGLVHAFPEDTATVVSPEKFEDASSENISPGEKPNSSPFADFVDNAKKTVDIAKKTVVDIVDKITHFFEDIFRKPDEADAGNNNYKEIAGGSFVALALAVILVVLFKRSS